MQLIFDNSKLKEVTYLFGIFLGITDLYVKNIVKFRVDTIARVGIVLRH